MKNNELIQKKESRYQKAKRAKDRFPNCMALFFLAVAAGGMALPFSREAAVGMGVVALGSAAMGAKAFVHEVKKHMRERQRAD